MQVQVKHNGSTITSRVIGYSREHRICTGIGTLDITIEGTYNTAINPWDTIDIHENGDFKVRYYVSDISHSVPDGNIVLQCQDKSKRLVDYFIPDSYTIDYPSYTRYWIEKFLDEAGINYDFTVSSQGNLLSNYTALGLQPAYDQIMMLLQLSGWYMYFDGNGTAVIGSLDIDLADTVGTLGKTDILDIKRITNDKMLRNRALVWGEFNPATQTYAFADVRRHTKWNYDHNDLRTMVISNHNIPNNASAHNIANILIKEFAKATIEKHIIAWGARDFNLGNAIKVNSNIWRGKGLITTFGTSLDRNGLVTNIILDERCPRLYGFFDFGDWVYVGTFGDGVWRKHIKFDPNFYNFSTGLTNLNITDMHINNGIFGSVGHSGEMFYANSEDGPWHQIPPIESLLSSEDDIVENPSGLIPISGMVPFSGIMARAVIVDKESNNLKFGVDTSSGINYGDYFMMYSGFVHSSGTVDGSGFPTAASGAERGWIVEYDPFTGTLVGDIGSGVYPIHYSGNYSMQVLDLENDGSNDYVSVRSDAGELMIHTEFGYDFGSRTARPLYSTEDLDTRVSFPTISIFDASGKSLSQTITGTTVMVSVFDNEAIDEHEILYLLSNTIRRRKITKTLGVLGTSSDTSPNYTTSGKSPFCIRKVSTDVYNLFFVSTTSNHIAVSYKQWDVLAGTLSGENSIINFTINIDIYHSASGTESFSPQFFSIDNTIYLYTMHFCRNGSPSIFDPDFALKANNYIEIYKGTVNMDSLSGSAGLVFSKDFNTADQSLSFAQQWKSSGYNNNGTPYFSIFQRGNVPSVFVLVNEWSDPTFGADIEWYNWAIYANEGSTFTSQIVQQTFVDDDPNFVYRGGASIDGNGNPNFADIQLTGEQFIYYVRYDTSGAMLVYNGESVTPTVVGSIAWQLVESNIYAQFGSFDTHYIAKNGSTWYFVNPQTFSPEDQLVLSGGYSVTKPFSTTDSISPYFYWHGTNSLSQRVILRTSTNSIVQVCKPASFNSFTANRAFICGNFFVDLNEGGGTLTYLYLNNDTNVPNNVINYMVLQREGTDYNLIRNASKPIRIDISNNSPVLTVLDVESTFESYYIYNDEVTAIIPTSGLDVIREVRDYRYTMLEVSEGLIASSGAGVGATSQILYPNVSGIFSSDPSSYSGGFIMVDSIGSGNGERIETTNYTYPGQYIFVTTSGDDPLFYQRDNDGLLFESYSGLPSSRATIIRCDDRL